MQLSNVDAVDKRWNESSLCSRGPVDPDRSNRRSSLKVWSLSPTEGAIVKFDMQPPGGITSRPRPPRACVRCSERKLGCDK
ncbi:hypothetical protein KC362_g30 [Hortaea werneckii]|nr:hypothetical protein KC362_g30 [Hortaea werneckii]